MGNMSEEGYRSGPRAYRSRPERRSKPERVRPQRETTVREHRADAQKSGRRKRRALLVAGVAVLIATVALAAALIPDIKSEVKEVASSAAAAATPRKSEALPSNTDEPLPAKSFLPPAAAPLVYESGGKIFLTNAGNRINLAKSAELYGGGNTLRAAFSGDNRFLYYISGFDINTGEGALMAAASDGTSPPSVVAEGVCAAVISYDGSKVMYITDAEGAAGALYIAGEDGSAQIAQSVVPAYFAFSDSGDYITYVVREGANTFAVYAMRIGGEPEAVTRVTAAVVIDSGLSLTRFCAVIPLDNGQVAYSVEENYNMPVYLYTSGEDTERLCNDGYIVRAFSSGGFLFAETGHEARPLWYKAPGKEPSLVSENYDYIKPEKYWPGAESRFLLAENIGEGAENPGVMLYEAEPGGEKSAISLATGESIEINGDFNCAAYERDGKLYVSRKTQGGWKESFLTDASAREFAGEPKSGIKALFDESGENLYFFDEFKTGPLYRYSAKDGVTTSVVKGVDWFFVIGDVPFAHTADDKLYMGAQSPSMVMEGVREVRPAQGGAYLLTADGKVCFVAEGKQRAVTLDSFSRTAALSGSIAYCPALWEDAEGAIEALSGEVNFCLYKLGVYRDKYPETLGADKAAALCAKLIEREDVSALQHAVLKDMHKAFETYGLWTRKKAKRAVAAGAMERAAQSYSDYSGTPEGE